MREGWNNCKLGELLEIKYGKDHKKLNDGKYPLYGSGGIMRYVDQYLYDDESILIPRKGTLTNLFYLNSPFSTVDTMFWSKINKEKIFPKFLYYILKTYDFSTLDEGAAIPSLTTKTLKEVLVKIPESLETQRKIASILSGYDDLIENNLKRIKILEEMAQQTYEEWFVRMRFPGYESAVMNEETGLPEGWEKVKLGEKVKLISGFAFKSKDFQDDPNDKIIVRMGNFQVGGGLKFQKNKYLVDGVKVRSNHILNPFDLLMVLSDVTREGLLIGNVGFVPNDSKNYFLNQRVSKLVTDERFKYYLFDVLNSQDFKNNCIAKANSVTVLNLKNDDINNYELTIPKLDILEDFTVFSKNMRHSIFNLISQNQRLREARDLLLPRLMMGIVEV